MLEKIPLAPLTTLGIGGPARWLAEVRSELELVEAIGFAREQGLPYFVLGGGSNLLVADDGFDGLVLRLKMQEIVESKEVSGRAGGLLLSAEAGVNWDDFVRYAIENNGSGVECLAGIPGTVGGTPVQNVGAYGQDVAETIVLVRAYDTLSGQYVELDKEACGFGYRSSIFNGLERGRYIVTRVEYALGRGGPKIAYKDVQKYFAESGVTPTLQSVSEAVREIRKAKGMLLVEGEADCRSAGSFFKNPVVNEAKIADLEARMRLQRGEVHGGHVDKNAPVDHLVPRFPAGPGYGLGMVKIPAAWLVEQAGFHKGFRLGRAGISSRHTLALINLGGATAAEIVALRDLIVDGVEARFGIRLEQEPVMLGF